MRKNLWIGLCLLGWVGCGSLAALADLLPTYPHTTIQNNVLIVELYLPDAEQGYYRGTRFEWSGIVQQIHYAGHTFFGDWKTGHNPANHDDVNAIASEFGMHSPLGYAEAKPGESFVKMGVGELIKAASEPYHFASPYTLAQPLAWTVTQGTDWIEFQQSLPDFKGWGYDYTKQIELSADAPVMRVHHTLKNTGHVNLDTDYYCHNFTIIDEDPIGPDYQLEFPFVVTTSNDMKGYAEARGTQIHFVQTIPDSFHTLLQGWEEASSPNEIMIKNTKRGVALRIRGDRAPHQFALWTTALATCPEPFIPIFLKPGETMTWQDEYTFMLLPSALDEDR
ncbi:MAG: hypothetical protein RBU29_11465 [bacterium]|jgi:hypothetical protein|nr:hypothetical protein [bacterium]